METEVTQSEMLSDMTALLSDFLPLPIPGGESLFQSQNVIFPHYRSTTRVGAIDSCRDIDLEEEGERGQMH